MDKKFYGRYLFGLHTDFYRDRPSPDSKWFRLWEELNDEEQALYQHIGMAMFAYFRASEGTEVLTQQLTELRETYETLRASVQKEWKERGGR
jgi:hypothetical protein